jgi:hypothetical protein
LAGYARARAQTNHSAHRIIEARICRIYFDGNDPVEARISRFPDFSHATRAQ